MAIKHIRKLWLGLLPGVALVVTLVLYSMASHTHWFQLVFSWSKDHVVLLCLALFLIKIFSIIWPPLPGIVFTVAAVPILGWWTAFLIDYFGSITGTSLAFALGRHYGPRVILLLFGKGGLEQVRRLKFKPDKELEAIFLMRVFGGPVSEMISYGSGLTNIKFRNFFLGTASEFFIAGLILFYLLSFVFNGGNLLFGIIPLAIGAIIMYRLRHRYFHLDD